MATTNKPVCLSIVIVNSDGLDDTLNCLESIFRYSPQEDFEVVLIDNCSEVPITEIVHKEFDQVRIFSAPNNFIR